MKKLIIFAIAVFIGFNLRAEQVEIIQLFKKLDDSTYLFADNSERTWYTIEIKADTIFAVESTVIFANNKPMQFLAFGFDNGNPIGTRGNQQAERAALQFHKRNEFALREKIIGSTLKSGEELFFNKVRKPFLIWWFEYPKQTTRQKYEHKLENNQTIFWINEFAKLDATHQLFLTFNIHGDILVTISVPVLENENLQDEIEKLKNMANSLNVYGSWIDLYTLAKRLENPNYVFRDDENLIEIKLPSWLNVFESSNRNVFSASFPEKDNITNAVGIVWRSKSDFEDFDDFISNFEAINPDENSLTFLNQEKKKVRYFYSSHNGWRRTQRTFIEGENAFYFIVFTGTETTYDFNLPRFYELMERITFR